ncbi:ribonuclease III domain-containing protein [Leptodontidium sp. MPI-SDFR-AT-0119]|nr:ribonuclease III domain-containing protein [Leptodontidium sp. MPI-SDFR-AT-0119]
MFPEKYLIQLQENIGYMFSDIFLLEKALTTAGAEGNKESPNSEERDKYDGNRKLANIGDKLLQLIVIVNVFSGGDKRRSDASDAVLSAADKDTLEARAKDFEIDKHLKLNLRLRGRPTKTTLSTAVNAIIGAAWQDSQEDMDTARSIIERFGQVMIFQIPYPMLTTKQY